MTSLKYTPIIIFLCAFIILQSSLLNASTTSNISANHWAEINLSKNEFIVQNNFSYNSQNNLNLLYYEITLPSGGTIVNASGEGNPEYKNNEIIFSGNISKNPLYFNYTIRFPAEENGTKEITSKAFYWFSDETSNPSFIFASPSPIIINLSSQYPPSDITPPNSISNLKNISSGSSWIYWNWTNPLDADFAGLILYLNGNNLINITNTSINFYNSTNLSQNTSYTLIINTIDNSSNINKTNISLTALTLTNNTIINDTTPPSIISTYPENGASLSSGTTSIIIKIETNETSICRYNASNVSWENMTQFNSTNSTHHNLTISGLSNGQNYLYYFLCKDNKENIMNFSYQLSFSVNSPSNQPSNNPGTGGNTGGTTSTNPVNNTNSTNRINNTNLTNNNSLSNTSSNPINDTLNNSANLIDSQRNFFSITGNAIGSFFSKEGKLTTSGIITGAAIIAMIAGFFSISYLRKKRKNNWKLDFKV